MKRAFFTSILKVCHRNYLIFLGLLISGFVLGQNSDIGGDNPSLKFGVKLGTSVSSFTNQQPHNSIIMGLSGGGFVNFSISENIAFQVDAIYTQEGGRLLNFEAPWLIGQDYWYMISAENQRLVLHNVNLPVVFKYSMLLNSFNLVYIIGADMGYTFSAIAHKEATIFTEGGGFHTYTENENISSNIENYNLAATAGIGIEIPAGNLNLLIDARYKYGITPVYKSYSYMGIPQLAGDLKCHSVNISIGIGF